jgi:hypothetical protein
MTRRLLLVLAATWRWSSRTLAEEPAKPNPNSGRDSAVMEAVITYMLKAFETRISLRIDRWKQVVLLPNAATGRLTVSGVALPQVPEQWDRPCQEAAENLVQRLDERNTFKDIRLKDPRFVIKDPPGVRQYLEAYAPGYSKDGQLAMVRLHVKLHMHSAIGTCVMVKKDGKWDGLMVRGFFLLL